MSLPKIHLYNLFIVFKQVFDSVSRGRMLNDLILGIPKKLMQPINMTMAGSKANMSLYIVMYTGIHRLCHTDIWTGDGMW
jgi:hypothetical protein